MTMTALIAAAAAIAGLMAQPQSVPEPDIVVEGVLPTQSQVETFVDSLAWEPGRMQLGRFTGPACPVAMGLQPSQNAQLERRLRQVGQAAGVPLAAAGCRPNMIVVVTRDKRTVVEQLKTAHPEYFIDLTVSHSRRLARDDNPVSAWQVTTLRSYDGVDAVRDFYTGAYTTVSDPQRGASRVAVSSHRPFAFSAVVIEVDSIAGLSTTQVADYAAMRGFAQIDPERLEPSSIPTILRAINAPFGTAVPVTLTPWDLHYLRALYRIEINATLSQQRAEMRRLLRAFLETQTP